MFEMIINNNKELKNKKLDSITKRINNCAETAVKSMYEIGGLLAEVKANKLYEDDGFKDVVEYANVMFGIKKSTTYALIAVNRKFILPEKFVSIFATANGEDFTYKQLEPLTKLEVDRVNELVNDGTIKFETSVREIAKIVKNELNPETDGDGTDGDGTDGDGTDGDGTDGTDTITVDRSFARALHEMLVNTANGISGNNIDYAKNQLMQAIELVTKLVNA